MRRVTFISTSAGVWGAELSLLSIAEGLRDLGHPVELVCASADLERSWTNRIGDSVMTFARPASRLGRILRIAVLLFRCTKDSTVVSFDVDAIPVFALGRPLLRRRKIRSAVDLHILMSGRVGRIVLDTLGGGVDHYVAVSEFIAQQVRPTGVPTAVAWRPMVLGKFSPRPIVSGERLRIGVVGRIDPEKRLELAIDAVALLGERYELVVRGAPFGDGAYADSIAERGASKLGERYVYEGRVSQEVAMAGLDFLLLCNDKEPSGRVVAEAQAAGAMPIVPDRGGSSEFVAHLETGLVYASESPESIASVVGLLTGPEQRSEILMRGREFALANYDPGAQALKYASSIGLGQ